MTIAKAATARMAAADGVRAGLAGADAAGAAELIESTASDFVDARGLAARSTSAVHLLVLAPPSSAWDAGGAWHACQIGVEALLRQGVRKLSNVHLLTYQESRRL